MASCQGFVYKTLIWVCDVSLQGDFEVCFTMMAPLTLKQFEFYLHDTCLTNFGLKAVFWEFVPKI